MNISQEIETFIQNYVAENKTSFKYGRPVVAFADAQDPEFLELKKVAVGNHNRPVDLLPDARTVICYFIPYSRELIADNRDGEMASRSWALAYVVTNKLIADLNQALLDHLAKQGINGTFVPATHNFDKETLTAPWSHRHVGYVAGLGTFGLNNMLITASGCAGRLGSLVINAAVPPTVKNRTPDCLFHQGKKCGVCLKKCPTGALTEEGFNRRRCYDHLLKVGELYQDIGLCDVCGKCVVAGPCARKKIPPGEKPAGETN